MDRNAAPGFDIIRVNISLPCTIPVLPGTPDTDAPIEQRTEVCAVDAFWVVGLAHICDHHLAQALGEDFAEVTAGHEATYHGMPWAERHRYDQESTRRGLPERHPLYLTGASA